ncbi:MAG: hypothetical protein ACI8Z1_002867 [Candidatus Azotimanducaceae bacterium]|jgi:hypothetical protein
MITYLRVSSSSRHCRVGGFTREIVEFHSITECRHLGVMQEITVEYHGARISVRIESISSPADNGGAYPVSLLINGLQRDKDHLKPSLGSVRLSSPVQTDYEWHEIIEATIALKHHDLTLSLTANQQPLASKVFKL